MKKFLTICVILFITNLGCKKMGIDGSGTCACSPVKGPELYLVIKNNAGEDLLNEKTTGAYTKDKIELFRKDVDGKKIPLNFGIRPTFLYGDKKFNFNQLFSGDIMFLQKTGNNIIYLKLGADKVYELNLELHKEFYEIAKITIDKKEAEQDKDTFGKKIPIFYLNTDLQ